MKIPLIVVITACLAMSDSAPATRAVDWTAVEAKVKDIEIFLFDTMQEINDIATNDNAEVGAEVAKLLDVVAAEGTAIITELHKAVLDQTLTADQASALINKLLVTVLNVWQSSQGTLHQLSSAAYDSIRVLFNITLATLDNNGRELYALLTV